MVEKEIKATMEMYMNIKTSVIADRMRSEWFDVRVKVYQELEISPLLFAVATDEVTKDITKGAIKELV